MEKELLDYFGGDELASTVWEKKYKFEGEKTPKDSNKRYVKEISEKEIQRLTTLSDFLNKRKHLSEYGKNRYDYLLNINNTETSTSYISEYIKKFIGFDKIIPGGSMLASIGNYKLYSSLSNCFVLGRPYDSYMGISQKTEEMSEVMKRRGGAGIDISSIRPTGAVIHNQATSSSGPVLFANRYSNVTLEIAQNGRRGALMLSIHINHPDSILFAEEKQDLTKLTGANTSIIFSDEFMKATEGKSKICGKYDFIQRFPVDVPLENFKSDFDDLEYDKTYPCTYFDGKVNKTGYIRKINAKKAWNKITEYARNTAEPGIIFEDNWYQWGTDGIYEQYKPVTTNPCFPGFTTIQTKYGLKTFEELSKLDKCYLINPIDNNSVEGKVWSNGIKKIVKVILRDNNNYTYEYFCTPNHKHLMYDESESNCIVSDFLPERKNLILTEIKDCLGKCIYGAFNKLFEVIDIQDAGECEVFDFKMFDGVPYGYITNLGIIAHNCSEIPMQPYDSCRLLSTNLYSFVKNPFTKDAYFDFDEAYKIFYEQMTLGDIIVDLEEDYIKRIIEKIEYKDSDPRELKDRVIILWDKILKSGKEGRRVGAGFTALGDTLAALGLKYNYSDKTQKVLNDIFETKMRAELDATIDMSILYGSFVGFDINKEYYISDDFHSIDSGKNEMFNRMLEIFPEQINRMCKYGRRNVSWSTAAPTGSLSILSQTTSGIEPLFSPFYMRRKKVIDEKTERIDYIDPADGQKFTMFPVFHPKFKWWIENIYKPGSDATKLTEEEVNEIFKTSPWFGSCANDINWKDRVYIQSLVQKYTTHAISSTINLPNDIKTDIVKNIYTESWKVGLKGNTIYRDGSRGGVLVTSTNTDNKNPDSQDFDETRAPKRPIRLPAVYHTIRSKGKTYSVIIGFYQNKPYEVFIASDYDYLPQNLDDYNDCIKGEIVKEGKDWYNFESKTFILKEISDIENEEKMLSLMISMALRHRTPLKYVIKTIEKTKPFAGSFAHKLIKILSKYVPDGEESGTVCPDCGAKLRYEGGCCVCPDCGWSKC